MFVWKVNTSFMEENKNDNVNALKTKLIISAILKLRNASAILYTRHNIVTFLVFIFFAQRKCDFMYPNAQHEH